MRLHNSPLCHGFMEVYWWLGYIITFGPFWYRGEFPSWFNGDDG